MTFLNYGIKGDAGYKSQHQQIRTLPMKLGRLKGGSSRAAEGESRCDHLEHPGSFQEGWQCEVNPRVGLGS